VAYSLPDGFLHELYQRSSDPFLVFATERDLWQAFSLHPDDGHLFLGALPQAELYQACSLVFSMDWCTTLMRFPSFSLSILLYFLPPKHKNSKDLNLL
jgi:hypothetical protein